ncbi:MAG: 50S ribosomal protein L16 [Nitrososphaerota archaeon]
MHAKNYRKIERPYTRAEFIHGAPQPRLAKYDYGNWRGDYEYEVSLIAETNCQIRDVALESARVSAGKTLTAKLGDNFYLAVKVHPHHVLRENKMIFGAHADRLQEGMSRAFGRPIGRAAQVEAGTKVLTVHVYRNGIEAAREALKIAAKKLPKNYRIEIIQLKKEVVSSSEAN